MNPTDSPTPTPAPGILDAGVVGLTSDRLAVLLCIGILLLLSVGFLVGRRL